MNREELEKAHQHSQKQYEEYLTRKNVPGDHKEKLQQAKQEWELAWNKLMETLLVLERLEI